MTTEPTKPDYKSTICLPQTAFPMRANLNQKEPEILARWQEIDLRGEINNLEYPNGSYILHDGPPYANGPIHVGHALNKVLKDIIVRHRTMCGMHSPYVPGWDCHGLPIEQKVSSELGHKKKSELTPGQLRDLCEQYARKWINTQREGFKRLGIGGEWDKPYLTLDPKFEAGELEALKILVEKGFVYKGLKPVFWCTSCQTALADAEVEYQDKTSPSIYVKFPFVNPSAVPALEGLVNPGVVIWTTTPWTLPANVAVSLHPDFEYVAIRVPEKSGNGEEDYIVAKELVENFVAAAEIPSFTIVKDIKSRDLEKVELVHPIQPDRNSVIVLGDHVTLEAGTGAVHTAPGHGMEDYLVSLKYGLPIIVPVDHRGRYTDEFSLMEGMSVWEANEPIIRYLDEKNILINHKAYNHSYAHCWRCRNPIIYRATEQWFMDVDHDDLRKKTLESIDNKVRWIPSWGQDRIHNMMAARPDWCLSRQRVWGVPIPAVVCTSCRKATLSPELIEKVKVQVAERGSSIWWNEDISNFLPDGFACSECGQSESFEKEYNILDVWFDSGVSHLSVLKQGYWDNLKWPADLYLEGSDQHRGWFHTSLLTSMGMTGEAPYKAVLTHGFVLDGKGEAMSKSKGNVIAPDEIIKKYGADVLRLWVTSEDYRNDLKLSEEILQRVAEGYRRIRNTLRYLLGNVQGFNPETDAVPYDQLEEIDKWILHEFNKVSTAILKAYEDYEFHKIYHLATGFCVTQLSSVYLDVTKDRMYCSGTESQLRKAAQTVQFAVLDNLLRLLAPILVFTADEAHQSLDKTIKSVHLLRFNSLPEIWNQPDLGKRWEKLLSVRTDVLRALEDARQVKKAIGQSLEAQVLVAPKDESLVSLLNDAKLLLPELFITSQAVVTKEAGSIEADNVITSLDGSEAVITVLKAQGEKCERCWRVLPDVGQDSEHSGLCNRCVDVLRRHYNGNNKEGDAD